MRSRVLLALVSGLRPDAVAACGHPFYKRLRKMSTECANAQTVRSAAALPCCISLFTGVEPRLHGNVDNVWRPYPRPYDGILETVHDAGGKTAMAIAWEPLRYLGRADSIDRLELLCCDTPSHAFSDALLFEKDRAKRTADLLSASESDFVFYSFSLADAAGRAEGWNSGTYLDALRCASDCLELLIDSLPACWQSIVTSDCGGYRGVGAGRDTACSRTVPICCTGSAFARGRTVDGWKLLDVAPTVYTLLGTETPEYCQGKSWL